MMEKGMAVWKFTIGEIWALTDQTVIPMPPGAQMLHVGIQHERLCVWALVDPERFPVPHRFRVVGTGRRLEQPGAHIGSFMMAEGNLVFHVFDEGEA